MPDPPRGGAPRQAAVDAAFYLDCVWRCSRALAGEEGGVSLTSPHHFPGAVQGGVDRRRFKTTLFMSLKRLSVKECRGASVRNVVGLTLLTSPPCSIPTRFLPQNASPQRFSSILTSTLLIR